MVCEVMRKLFFGGLSMGLFLTSSAMGQTDAVTQANQLESQGQFKKSAAALNEALKNKSLSDSDRKKLEFELDRLDRIKKDFPDTKDALFAQLKRAVKNL